MAYRRTYIREWRKARNLTLERLADRVGFAASTLSRMERGQQPYSQPILEALADALRCEPADLIMRPPPSKDDLDLWAVIQGMSPARKNQLKRIVEALEEEAAA